MALMAGCWNVECLPEANQIRRAIGHWTKQPLAHACQDALWPAIA
jgi:hypothetical protein